MWGEQESGLGAPLAVWRSIVGGHQNLLVALQLMKDRHSCWHVELMSDVAKPCLIVQKVTISLSPLSSVDSFSTGKPFFRNILETTFQLSFT